MKFEISEFENYDNKYDDSEQECDYDSDGYEEQYYLEEENDLEIIEYQPLMVEKGPIYTPPLGPPNKLYDEQPSSYTLEFLKRKKYDIVEIEYNINNEKSHIWDVVKELRPTTVLNNNDYPVLGYIPPEKNDGFELVSNKKRNIQSKSPIINTKNVDSRISTPPPKTKKIPNAPKKSKKTKKIVEDVSTPVPTIIRVPHSIVKITEENMKRTGKTNYIIEGF